MFGENFDVPAQIKRIGEAEDPRQTLKQSAKDVFVVWTYYAGITYFMRLEKRWGTTTFMWVQEQHMASRFRTQEDAEALKDWFYADGKLERDCARVSTMSQALAYRGESEDPKHFLKAVAGTLPPKCFRVNWLDQHGNIHHTSFRVPSEEIAIAHLRHNSANNWSRAYQISDIISVDDISSLKEAEDPKAVFKKLWQVVEIPLKGPGLIMGRWKGASNDFSWSYWGDFPEGWGWSPRRNDATVLRHSQLRPAIERIQREAPDQVLRVVPVTSRPRFEAREHNPFDLLKFPTDAAQLARKLLELPEPSLAVL
jgi:hypothetical protein